MSDTTYNGWTNYATWRVNLEIFDDLPAKEFFDLDQEPYNLGKELREFAETLVADDKNETTLTKDYALAFLSYVNWVEIATHMIQDHAPASA
jgi:hypothetical protein